MKWTESKKLVQDLASAASILVMFGDHVSVKCMSTGALDDTQEQRVKGAAFADEHACHPITTPIFTTL